MMVCGEYGPFRPAINSVPAEQTLMRFLRRLRGAFRFSRAAA